VIKSSPESVFDLATQLRRHGFSLVILAYNAVIHGYSSAARKFADLEHQIQRLLQPIESQLASIGGDWSSRHVVRPEAKGMEAEWLSILLEEFVKV